MPQEAKDRSLANCDLPLRQFSPKLRQCDIRLRRHQLPEQFLMRGQRIRFVPAEFRRIDFAGFALASEKPSDRTQTDVMSLRRFLQRRTLLDGNDHAYPQIARIRLRHSCWPPPSTKLESDSFSNGNPPIQPFRKTL